MSKGDREEATTTVSRRAFAKSSVAAAAVAVALPKALHGETLASTVSTAVRHTAVTPAPRIAPPKHVIGYGDVGAHPSTVAATATNGDHSIGNY